MTSDYFKSYQDCARGKKVACTAVTITFTTTVVNTNFQPQFWSVKSKPFVIFPQGNYYLYIPQENPCVMNRGEKNKQKSRNISLATDENQYIYSYDKLVTEQTLA